MVHLKASVQFAYREAVDGSNDRLSGVLQTVPGAQEVLVVDIRERARLHFFDISTSCNKRLNGLIGAYIHNMI